MIHSRGSDAASLLRSVAAFRRTIDPKLGIIRSVTFLKPLTHDAQVFAAYAEPCDTRPLAGIRGANRGGACAVSKERAFVRSCGEAIERYCSSFFDFATFRITSETELQESGERFVSVRDLYSFSRQQGQSPEFPFDVSNAESQIRWVAGRGERTGDRVWVPASTVYVPYQFDKRVEPFTHMPISTGLAAGDSTRQCIDKGVLEILERDALMLTWNCRLSAPRVSLRSCLGISAEIDQLIGAQDVTGGHWHINLITRDIAVPIVTALLINADGPPMTSFGVSAGRHVHAALRNAMEEALLSRILLNRGKELNSSSPPQIRNENMRTLRHHLLMHAVSRDLSSELHVFTECNEEITAAEAQQRFPELTESTVLASLPGLEEPITVEVTTQDVADLGIHVCRTIIPFMQPLDNDHRFRYLGGRRLHAVAAGNGIGMAGGNAFNPAPHPFP